MKELKSFGVAGIEFNDPELASGYTYTTNDGRLFSTPLIFPDNPFNETVKNAKVILDIGCGVGRNLEWIMENTEAQYIGLDPNDSMIKYFWNYNEKYRGSLWDKENRVKPERVQIVRNFVELNMLLSETVEDWGEQFGKIDVVVSTFVFQHIGFRPPEGEMNVADITKEAGKYATDDTVWILYEHDWEEQWIGRWINETNLYPEVYKRDYTGIEELTHRAPHHLLICKGVPE